MVNSLVVPPLVHAKRYALKIQYITEFGEACLAGSDPWESSLEKPKLLDPEKHN